MVNFLAKVIIRMHVFIPRPPICVHDFENRRVLITLVRYQNETRASDNETLFFFIFDTSCIEWISTESCCIGFPETMSDLARLQSMLVSFSRCTFDLARQSVDLFETVHM